MVKSERKVCKSGSSWHNPLLSLFMSSCVLIIALSLSAKQKSAWYGGKGIKKIVNGCNISGWGQKTRPAHWCSCSWLDSKRYHTHKHTHSHLYIQLGFYVMPTQQSRSLRERGLCVSVCAADCGCSPFSLHSSSSDWVTLDQTCVFCVCVSACVCACVPIVCLCFCVRDSEDRAPGLWLSKTLLLLPKQQEHFTQSIYSILI